MSGRLRLAREVLAWILVILTVLAVWKFVDYRNQPPPVKAVTKER